VVWDRGAMFGRVMERMKKVRRNCRLRIGNLFAHSWQCAYVFQQGCATIVAVVRLFLAIRGHYFEPHAFDFMFLAVLTKRVFNRKGLICLSCTC